MLLKVADELGVEPTAGVRIKLATEGSGRWAKSGGEKSKFGLSAAQLMKLRRQARSRSAASTSSSSIHFHLGSQITDIRYIKAGLQEVARYYAELREHGRSTSRTWTSAAGSAWITTASRSTSAGERELLAAGIRRTTWSTRSPSMLREHEGCRCRTSSPNRAAR